MLGGRVIYLGLVEMNPRYKLIEVLICSVPGCCASNQFIKRLLVELTFDIGWIKLKSNSNIARG